MESCSSFRVALTRTSLLKMCTRYGRNLEKYKIPYQLLVFDDEGHGIHKASQPGNIVY